MGKPGAYLEHGRVAHGERPALEAIRDFKEYTEPLGEDQQRQQASRCMMCGVAFCQFGAAFGHARNSGCPLHNLIPEWNDLVYRGLWAEAAQRLALTNPFPEFTGRICPALCEAACNLAYVDEATTIRDNERAISDHEWAEGGPEPLFPAPADAPHVAVVGSGPCGLGVAWRLTLAGVRVTVFERHDRAGGLLMYGIPTMKLPKDVVQRRIDWLERCGVVFELNTDAADPAVAERLTKDFDAVVVAAGAAAARGLNAPGADAEGVVYAVDYLTKSTLANIEGHEPAVNAKGLDVVVIGGGDTGTDCVATAVRQGCKSLKQLEYNPAPPEERMPDNPWPEWPMVKKFDYGIREATTVFGEDPRLWATDTTEVLTDEAGHVTGLRVSTLDRSGEKPVHLPETERILPAQLVILACGFFGPEAEIYQALGCEASEGPRVRPVMVEGTHRVSHAGSTLIYAAGDAKNGSTLVVNTLADGLLCAEEVAKDLLAR